MDAGKRPRQAYVEDCIEEGDDSDSDVPLSKTQAKRLKRCHTHDVIPLPHPTSQPAQAAQDQPAFQPTVTAIPPRQTQHQVRRRGPRAPAPSVRSLLPATAVINSARQAYQSFAALQEPSRPQSQPAATAIVNALSTDVIDLDPPEPRWPPLPDINNIPHSFLFYAEEIRIVVNMLCDTGIDRNQFFEHLRHQDTSSLARPIWTTPEISEQKEIGFLCGMSTPRHRRKI
ncbi:hypothetical protein FGADI_5412 [Fusarium gaditjirri]|uniref:Uncharacterized protein n=1 Tax=Fusarium gaditjirri TaxID=282569 RepID=A0A8H4WY73_9HYPO|nr:hypothetical protein FGADI_5412 [Fusarium gaditjirri]